MLSSYRRRQRERARQRQRREPVPFRHRHLPPQCMAPNARRTMLLEPTQWRRTSCGSCN